MDLNTAVSFANSAIKNLQLNEWQSRQLLGTVKRYRDIFVETGRQFRQQK